MTQSYIGDVQSFHDKFGLATPPAFTFVQPELHSFRLNFLREELQEYIDSVKTDDFATAVDSLIDLVYVACGTALLAGIDVKRFETMVEESTTGLVEFDAFDDRIYFKPRFLKPESSVTLTLALEENIRQYNSGHSLADEGTIINALVAIYKNCLIGALKMGITPELWDELWADVQRANMSKERAVRADQSKRGSTFDVFKPIGWRGPQTEEILAKYR